QAEDGIRDGHVTGVQTCALPISSRSSGRLRPEDLEGGTFTVSNLGMFGDVDSFVAIINPPHTGILAVGKAMPRPVVRDGQIVARSEERRVGKECRCRLGVGVERR